MQSEEDLSYEDNNKVLQMLEEGIQIRRLQANEDWKLIDRIMKKMAKDAQRKLADIPVKVENHTAMVEMQLISKLYGDVLGNLIKSFISVGEMAFEEAKSRGLIQNPDDNTVCDTE